ncbi:MAG: adenosine monophosphate-protein transferase [Alphaproteobacteria bacterium]|nr:adenosine monophosphate-protein transferase [Alphaproteobacteria bacterium]
MYGAFKDPYCYPGTSILRNLPDLRDRAALQQYEAMATAQRADEPLPNGRLGVAHYRAIHRHLFQDVYDWAGRFGTVSISKNGNTFCYPENIDREMSKLFEALRQREHFKGAEAEAFVLGATRFLAELNAIHPFREGNGRTQTTFLVVLAIRAGRTVRLDRLRPRRFLSAMIASFGGDDRPLGSELRLLVS